LKIAIAHLVGESPYSQCKNVDKLEVPMKAKELHDDYETRTWRHRMHVTKSGHVEIPGTCFAVAIKTAAKRLGIPVPGKRGQMFGKFFEAGVMVTDGITLPIKASEVPGERLFVPSDGKPGGGKRVYKTFPRIDAWEGQVKFYVFDDIITADVFKQVLVGAGMLVGIGRFRPENRGFYGRFSVKSIRWLDGEEAIAAE
jgi:hypothetical protein